MTQLQTRPFALCVQDKEKKKKESIFDLSKYIDKPIRVKFQGGREGGWIKPGGLMLITLAGGDAACLFFVS